MGDVWIPDAPIMNDILEECIDILEEQWEVYVENNDSVGKKKTALMGYMLVSGYYGALQGEEINRVDLGGMNQYWNEGSSETANKKYIHLQTVNKK